MPIVKQSWTFHSCPCGCGKSLRLLQGGFEYGNGSNVLFRTALVACQASEPHVWTQIGSGPWDGSDSGTWWVTLLTRVEDGNLATSITEPPDAPFDALVVDSGRMLTRDQVLEQPGAKEWACEVVYGLSVEHQDISSFVLGQAAT